MTIYTSQEIDKATFKKLSAIGAAYDVELKPKKQAQPFELSPADKSNFTALNCLDAMTSIYKGIEKLKDFQTI